MALFHWQGYRWMIWLGLAVLLLEVFVVAFRDDLLILFVSLIIDGSGILAGMWIVKKGRRKEAKDLEDEAKALALLRQAGFTISESERLCLLRRRYLKQEKEQATEDLSRLRFVRWLVATGKLTDQL